MISIPVKIQYFSNPNVECYSKFRMHFHVGHVARFRYYILYSIVTWSIILSRNYWFKTWTMDAQGRNSLHCNTVKSQSQIFRYGAVHKLCCLKIGNFWPTPPLSCLFTKGQLISKGLFAIFIWTKIATGNLKDFCPSL